MTNDRPNSFLNWEIRLHDMGKFLCNVSVHVKVFRPRLSCCITIKTSTVTYAPCLCNIGWLVVFDVSGWSIREDYCYTVLFSVRCESRLLCSVFMSWSKSCQVIECRIGITSLLVYFVFRQVNTESHVAVVYFTPVLKCLQGAPVGFWLRNEFNFRLLWNLILSNL